MPLTVGLERAPRKDLLFRVALGVSVAAVVLPILTTRYLPFTDAPEHAAVMATLRHIRDPAFAGPYELAIFRSQYLVYHLAGALLTAVVDDAELANRLLLALAGVAFPLSFGALLRATRRDDRLALFACLPFWSRSLVLGFLPFVASIPIAFYALALFFRVVLSPKRTGPKTRVGLAVLVTILFYAHVSTWMLVCLTSTTVALLTRRLRALAILSPSLAASGVWFLLGKLTLGTGTLADATETGRMGMSRSMLLMPRWLFDVWRGHGDELAATAWWSAFLLVALLSVRSVRRYSRRSIVLLYAPFACALALYLAMPWRVGAALMLNVRLAPVLVLLGFLPTRLPRSGLLASAALGLAFIANVVGGATAWRQCRAARAELGDFDGLLGAMGPGARLMTLNFDIRSPSTHVYPWAHVGSYHRVRAGGVAGFSFTELRHWPLQYRPTERPPKKEEATWDFDPCTFRNATDGDYYDFVLVRGDVNPFIDEPHGPIFRPVFETGSMTLFRKEVGTWPEKASPDPGPCRGP